jgi:hypothetical protein
MAKKPQTIISDIRCASDLPPEIGNKFVTKQLANLLKTTNCTMQLATYDNGVKLLVKFPKVHDTDIGGAFRLTAPNDSGLDRLAITVVGYKLASQLTFNGGLEAVNLNAYHTIGIYNVKKRSSQRIKQVFDAIRTMREVFAQIADRQAYLDELSNKINHSCKY